MNATCTLHPDRLATAACAECNRPTCGECTRVVAGKSVCAQCVEAIRARVAAQLNNQPGAPSAIPLNAPRAAAPGSSAGQPVQAAYQPPQVAPPQPLYQPPAAQSAPPDLAAGYPPRPAAAAPLDLSTGYAGAAPQPAPPTYGQPGQTPYGAPPNQAPYGAPQQAPYSSPPGYVSPVSGQSAYGARPTPATSVASPNIAIGIVIGIVLFVLLGIAEGMLAISMHSRIPFLFLINGLIIGHAVKAVCGVGHGQGIIAGVCSLLSCAIVYLMMYLAMSYFSLFSILLLFYTTRFGYRIAGSGARW